MYTPSDDYEYSEGGEGDVNANGDDDEGYSNSTIADAILKRPEAIGVRVVRGKERVRGGGDLSVEKEKEDVEFVFPSISDFVFANGSAVRDLGDKGKGRQAEDGGQDGDNGRVGTDSPTSVLPAETGISRIPG